jgi:hypothetical protein
MLMFMNSWVTWFRRRSFFLSICLVVVLEDEVEERRKR